MKKQVLILISIFVVTIGFFLFTRNSSSNSGTLFEVEQEDLEVGAIEYESEDGENGVDIEEGEIDMYGMVFVDVQGEVISPGVFEVERNVRVGYLIDLAGGLTNYGSVRGLNRAARIYDEMVIIVPHIEDDSKLIMELDSNNEGSANYGDIGLISLNTASSLELQSLPGIGPVLSENIIIHRTENGAFSSVDELINVDGIGAGILENIREFIKP